MSNSDIAGRIRVLLSINQYKATPKILKLCSKVDIKLDLTNERLSSRLITQIRCSILIMNSEIKRIKISQFFCLE